MEPVLSVVALARLRHCPAAADRRLFEDLAHQAAAALHALRLTADL